MSEDGGSEVCQYCGAPVTWQVTDYQLALSDDEELVGYAAICSVSCESPSLTPRCPTAAANDRCGSRGTGSGHDARNNRAASVVVSRATPPIVFRDQPAMTVD
jgi:hypothetical protein